ncbi:MAG: phage shock protein C [Gammaproteobacteria bacterium]|jgi:phage shock protein C
MSESNHHDNPARKLYLNKDGGIVGGVCAGIADYLGIDKWLVRIIAITLFVFTNSLVLFIYLLCWIFVDKKPVNYVEDPLEKEFVRANLRRKFSGANGFTDTVSRFHQLELRMRRLEAYITSKRFNLSREINDL